MVDMTELSGVLNENGIYDIDAYGWLNDEDVDSEYVGHAMRQLEPPFQHDFGLFEGRAAAAPRPSEAVELLYVATEDFISTMQLARLSIGLLLMHEQQGFGAPEPSLFELFYLDTVLKLNVASDRLRTVWMLAITRGETAVGASVSGRNPLWFTTPFLDADPLVRTQRDLPNEALNKVLPVLPAMGPLSEAIYKHRDRRNGLVHRIATRAAGLSGRMVRLQRELYDRRNAGTLVINELGVLLDGFPSDTHEVLGDDVAPQDAIAEMKSWYRELIQLSNLVFEAEHYLRARVVPSSARS
jgi:hypothetical protein